MIPTPDQLAAISRLAEGDLAETPYAVLLHAFAVHKRTAVVEIVRGPLYKEIVIETGVPVDCRSNVLGDTLTRFMVGRGMLTAEQEQAALQASAGEGRPAGEILVRQGLISPSDLYKVLQQNLAKKLLDGFTWRSGHFRVLDQGPRVESPLKVNVPQLVVIGIGKFTSPDEINAAIAPLVGTRLFLHPEPPFPLDDIRLNADQQHLVEMLSSGKRIDELAAETTIPFDAIMRLLYSLAVIGVVVGAENLPKTPPKPAPATVTPAAATPAAATPAAATRGTDAPSPAPAPVLDAAELAARREALMELYLRHRKQDAFDLLGLPETAEVPAIEDAFVAFARRYGPWAFAAPGAETLADKATEVLLAGGRAFGELCDVERRNALVMARRHQREERRKRPASDRFAIKTDLLDSEQQYRKGRALMDAGQHKEAIELLQFAHDFDPQNATYRAELAYCRYLAAPDRWGPDALKELAEVIRIEPQHGLGQYYAGLVASDLGHFDEAQAHLEAALRLLKGDRRPIAALKSLQEARKKKRRLFG